MNLLLLSWLVTAPALAQNAWDPTSDLRPGSLEALARDLDSTDAARRSFAIRELNRVARLSRKHEFGPLESPSTTDALINLNFMDEVVVPICMRHVSRDVEVVRCAMFLAKLETVSARPVLAAARSRAERSRMKKRINKSIATLDKAAEEQ